MSQIYLVSIVGNMLYIFLIFIFINFVLVIDNYVLIVLNKIK